MSNEYIPGNDQNQSLWNPEQPQENQNPEQNPQNQEQMNPQENQNPEQNAQNQEQMNPEQNIQNQENQSVEQSTQDTIPESGSEHGSPEGTEEKKKSRGRPWGSRLTFSEKLSARVNQSVKKRFKFPQMDLGGKKSYYILEAPSSAFDTIVRRTPREVNSSADEYIIPLGSTCIETILSAYGLSSSFIYADKVWLSLINEFNANKTEEKAREIVKYLYSASIIKSVTVKGDIYYSSNSIDLVESILTINSSIIASNFFDMVG